MNKLIRINDDHNKQLENAHKEFEKALLKHAFLRIHSTYLSEDLVQDTFLKTWKYIVAGGEIQMMKAFLYHILNGLIIDQYRKEYKKTISLEFLSEVGFDVPTEEPQVSEKAIDSVTMSRYISKLPKNSRKIMRMRVISDLTIEEISKKLKITKNSASVRLHRATKLIQDMYVADLR